MHPRLLLPLLALVLMSQCQLKKSDPQPLEPKLPPITQNGSNTIGFRVDGQVWLPKGSFNFPSWKAYYSGKMFYITANRVGGDTRDQFGIGIDPLQPGTAQFDLAERNGVIAAFSPLNDDFRVLAPGEGTLRFTRLDTVARIVAGTFEFEAVSATTGKTVRITDGRFDLRTN
ncbi:DUF6252 family protein [Hymenobacter arizonensis]|uniref:Uncharacterized protein n=1 Tax=Hymenobacter arizonensis TaxID=1227077 RepID=A0A1I6BP69_HYMAR|nr:DUF6252 family protein [Hymenobacter arizonensis]SFQ82701.1 hypothetical protein SAMN04515668_4868 [Hymenobacter arizonensis]